MTPIEERFFEILDTFGQTLVTDLKESLVKNDVVGGGGNASKLAGSIRFVFLKGNDQGIGITMKDYWEWVENGRKAGKIPPIDKIIAWIKWKGIVPKLSDKAKATAKGLKNKTVRKGFKQKSHEAQIKSFAFAIATNIGKHGTIKRDNYKGTNFAAEVLGDGRISELAELLADEIGIEVEVSVSKAFE